MIRVAPLWIWKALLFKRMNKRDRRIGIFRNLPGVIPGRWGFFILGFEFGSRNPGDSIGVWLKNHGLYPW